MNSYTQSHRDHWLALEHRARPLTQKPAGNGSLSPACSPPNNRQSAGKLPRDTYRKNNPSSPPCPLLHFDCNAHLTSPMNYQRPCSTFYSGHSRQIGSGTPYSTLPIYAPHTALTSSASLPSMGRSRRPQWSLLRIACSFAMARVFWRIAGTAPPNRSSTTLRPWSDTEHLVR